MYQQSVNQHHLRHLHRHVCPPKLLNQGGLRYDESRLTNHTVYSIIILPKTYIGDFAIPSFSLSTVGLMILASLAATMAKRKHFPSEKNMLDCMTHIADTEVQIFHHCFSINLL